MQLIDKVRRHLIDYSVKTGIVGGQRSELRCSFYGKDKNEVNQLVAGPNVLICDGCIRLCNDVISKAPVDSEDMTPEIDADG